MVQDLKDEDFARADDDTLTLILNEGDKRIAAQTALMVAADARANAVLAAAVALSAAGFAIAANEVGNPTDVPLLIAAFVFAIISTVAAIAAVAALWPTAVEPQGWNPALFVEDIAACATPHAMRVQMCRQMAKRIGRNRVCASRLTRRIRLAMLLLALSPLVGGAAGALSKGGCARYAGWLLLICAAAALWYFIRLSRRGSSPEAS